MTEREFLDELFSRFKLCVGDYVAAREAAATVRSEIRMRGSYIESLRKELLRLGVDPEREAAK